MNHCRERDEASSGFSDLTENSNHKKPRLAYSTQQIPNYSICAPSTAMTDRTSSADPEQVPSSQEYSSSSESFGASQFGSMKSCPGMQAQSHFFMPLGLPYAIQMPFGVPMQVPYYQQPSGPVYFPPQRAFVSSQASSLDIRLATTETNVRNLMQALNSATKRIQDLEETLEGTNERI